jgi:hypothetical protein
VLLVRQLLHRRRRNRRAARRAQGEKRNGVCAGADGAQVVQQRGVQFRLR